ncbi:Interleukin-1 receptor-like 1 [Microtus ochrogaster]|uniref:Interleukin-1 receptor-like 1 n=1 Tax=Microtus ochrogaster TaxID=79684 RepID=A0A8J6G384_MICOH|nr:Interleukin-1 receptor-like 1 [Microtus ochrogaster]
MSTQKSKGIVVSRDRLKFLPARMAHSGMYACVVTSPDLNMTEFMNVTIHRKTTGCNVPDHLMYKTVNGSAKNPKITCPTIFYYNWSAPVQWFKNCKALQGPKYRAHRAYLFIKNVGRDDEGDYTCKFTHTENGTSYIVTATRSFIVEADHQSTYYIVAGCSLLLMFISVLVIALKVFWIEVALFWRDIVTPYKIQNDGKLYDAYIIYPRVFEGSSAGTTSVEYFVHHTLPDVLEKKCGYKLCIYGRDLLPGQDAATVVESSIQNSRRHMFVLAPHMMHSKEFAYEQEVALHSALIQNNSKVILIEMEPLGEASRLQVGDLQDSLQHLVKMQGTIKWREDHVANKQSLSSKFWKHVRYQMPVPNKLPKMASGVVPLSETQGMFTQNTFELWS